MILNWQRFSVRAQILQVCRNAPEQQTATTNHTLFTLSISISISILDPIKVNSLVSIHPVTPHHTPTAAATYKQKGAMISTRTKQMFEGVGAPVNVAQTDGCSDPTLDSCCQREVSPGGRVGAVCVSLAIIAMSCFPASRGHDKTDSQILN